MPLMRYARRDWGVENFAVERRNNVREGPTKLYETGEENLPGAGYLIYLRWGTEAVLPYTI